MLELVAVSKRYAETLALDRCTFRAVPGRLTGFVGPNGAGKTTAMRVVFGLVRPDAGSVTWHGRPVTAVERRHFGYMPEERGLYPRMRVRDQLILFGRLSGLGEREAEHATDRCLADLELSQHSGSRLDDLSHGNQQRVQLAAALLHGPELVVLDEPFSGLDPFAMDAMARLLGDLARSGVAVLFSSHQLDLVEHLCEDVVIIDEGRVVLTGELDRLRDAAPDRYVDLLTREDVTPAVAGTPVEVLEQDGPHLRLRVPRDLSLGTLLTVIDGEVVRMTYEPPALSELFRDAVARSRAGEGQRSEREVLHVAP